MEEGRRRESGKGRNSLASSIKLCGCFATQKCYQRRERDSKEYAISSFLINKTDHEPAPSKPKLTARSKENKATWKIEKVPRISSFGLSEDTKSLLSCTLWKIYEGKKNPLQPVRYVLLAHEEGIKSKAMAWGIATTTIHQIKERLLEKHKKHDDRDLDIQLEQKFPGIRAMTKSFIFDTTDELDNDYTNSGMINTPGSNESISDSVALKKVCAAPIEVSSTDADLATPRMKVGPVSTNERQHGYSNDSSLSLGIDNQQNLAGQSNDTKSQKLSAGEVSAQIEKILDAMLHKDHDVISGVQTPLTNKGISTNSGSDYELESDEEIIVFNPRNRRTSGVRGSSSRPGSSGGFIQKTYKAGIQVNSRPTSSLGLGSLHGRMESLLKNETINNAPASQVQAIEQSDVNGSIIESNLKALLDSKLKAQSPVFTPGQPFLASPSGISAATGIMHTPAATVNSVTPPTGPRLPTTRNQGRPTSARGDGQELVRMQKENGQRIIQRQREVIQRQSKTAEMGMKTKGSASPRVIQMQPTNNPTIIDPDAFDRSYVVQPPTKPVPRHNGEKRRSRGNYNRNSAKESPKVNAKQNGHVAEPDVDFVLTCGAPRGSTRGKGKLWVP